MNYRLPSTDWYKKIWDLSIKDQSWVENTNAQVDFIIDALGLTGKEKILDLACGFGRHSLELTRRGYQVVGVDITECYIADAKATAESENLDITFLCSDLRDLNFNQEFDAVLNLADGAIGYLEDDQENNKIFQVIAKALKPGGKSLIDICNQDYAKLMFPQKHWEIGTQQISLPWFDYDETTKRMLYGGFDIPIGKVVQVPEKLEPFSSTRLYSYEEIAEIFSSLGLKTLIGYGDYNLKQPADQKHLQLIIVSQKN